MHVCKYYCTMLIACEHINNQLETRKNADFVLYKKSVHTFLSNVRGGGGEGCWGENAFLLTLIFFWILKLFRVCTFVFVKLYVWGFFDPCLLEIWSVELKIA